MGVIGDLALSDVPNRQKLSRCSQTWHLHCGRYLVHGWIHDEIVLSNVLWLWEFAFINVKQCMFGFTMRVLLSSLVALYMFVGS